MILYLISSLPAPHIPNQPCVTDTQALPYFGHLQHYYYYYFRSAAVAAFHCTSDGDGSVVQLLQRGRVLLLRLAAYGNAVLRSIAAAAVARGDGSVAAVVVAVDVSLVVGVLLLPLPHHQVDNNAASLKVGAVVHRTLRYGTQTDQCDDADDGAMESHSVADRMPRKSMRWTMWMHSRRNSTRRGEVWAVWVLLHH